MYLISFRRSLGAPLEFGAKLGESGDCVSFSTSAAGLPYPADPYACYESDGPFLQAARRLHAELLHDPKRRDSLLKQGAILKLATLELAAPVPRPRKVICIGLNYRDHATESGMAIPERPLYFSKFPTAVIGSGAAIQIPRGSTQVDYEAELGVVIGASAKEVSPEEALRYVLGYTIVNDVSARDFQFADGQWQRGKSPDTFCPMGPGIATSEEIPNPQRLAIRLRLNGQTMQDSSTAQLIFGIAELVSYLSQAITLEPGDLIATGTPPGVGFARKPPVYLRPGDQIEVEIEGLGVLRNRVNG